MLCRLLPSHHPHHRHHMQIRQVDSHLLELLRGLEVVSYYRMKWVVEITLGCGR
jgi:hypothetical protein